MDLHQIQEETLSAKDPNVVSREKQKRVAIVLSNPTASTTTGWSAGFWWSELAHPYYLLNEKGYQVELFSPDGGRCEPDAMSDPRDPSGYSAGDLHRKFVEFYEAGKIACALCHGVAVLRYARLSNGEYLAKGKTVTGFANVEEDFADNAIWSMSLLPKDKHVTPWRIEDELKNLGANYIQAGLWRGFAVRDGNLITGQQNFSPLETADTLVRALGE